MATTLIACQVCKECFLGSVGELHIHYLSQHSPEELSLALLVAQQLVPQSPHSSWGAEDLVLNKALARHPRFLQGQRETSSSVSNSPIKNEEPPQTQTTKDVSAVTDNMNKPKKLKRAMTPVEIIAYSSSESKSAKKTKRKAVSVKKNIQTNAIKGITKIDKSFEIETNIDSDSKEVVCQIVQVKKEPLSCKVGNIATRNSSTVANYAIQPSNVKASNKDVESQAGTSASKNNIPSITNSTDILTALGLAKRSPQLYQALLRKKMPERNRNVAETDRKSRITVSQRRELPPLLPAENFSKKTTPKFTQSILKLTQIPVSNNSVKKGDVSDPENCANTFPPAKTEIKNQTKHIVKVSDMLSLENDKIDGEIENEFIKNQELGLKMMDQESNDGIMSQPPAPSPLQDLQILPRGHERRYLCNRCPNTYKKKSHLDRHIKTHTGERPFECSVCNKRFTVRSVLKQHMRIHTGEKPYACSVCGVSFKQTSGLMTHMMLHTGKPYKCDLCEKSFVSNHKLLQHSRHHAGTKSYTCKTCSSHFFTSSALEQHERILHSSEKTHVCEICGHCFKLEVSLKVHLDNHIQELGGDEIIEQITKQGVVDEVSNASTEINSV